MSFFSRPILGERPLSLKRFDGPPIWVDGDPVASTSTIIDFLGYVEPASASIILTLSDTQRTKRPKMIITNTEIMLTDDATKIPGDVLTIDGREYNVVSCERIDGVLPHFEVIAVQIDRPTA